MSDQSFETQPHGFRVGRSATGFLRIAKGDLINVERLLHTSQITISIQRFQPYPKGLSSCLGSVANLIVVERARREDRIGFRDYAKVWIPLTAASLAAGAPLDRLAGNRTPTIGV